jgi:uncharacterized damage-inducible protein DinB
VNVEVRDARDLLGHMEWADSLMWQSIRALPATAEDAGLLDRLYHVHSVQWAYLQITRGEAVQVAERAALPDLRSIHDWAATGHRELADFSRRLDGAALERPLAFPWMEEVARRYGSAHAATVAESIVQIAMHTTHHRGQVAMQIRAHGGVPAVMDFIAWVWMGKPSGTMGGAATS